MKKMILSMLLLAGIGGSAMAQTANVSTTTYTPEGTVYMSPAKTPENATLVIPVYTERSFMSNYPSASRVTWYRVDDDWWRVSYIDNGPYAVMGYYALRGESYPISLPVRQTAVPENVVTNVLDKFTGVYDITETVGSDLSTQYIVRTIDANGQVMSNRVNASAVSVSK